MHFQHVVWALAFAVALAANDTRAREGRRRFVLGLWLGVVSAHLGWALFHLPGIVEDPGRILHLGAVSVLFLPVGVLLVAPWRESLAALPLALAIARIGCLPYACCYEVWWSALPEVVGLAGLHFAARRWPEETTPIVLAGFGAIRLLSLPLRSAPAEEAFVDPIWVALAWVVAGVALRHRIGTVDSATEWFTERSEPLLRALLLMFVVWLLFPLGAEVFEESSTALIVGCAAALALLLAVRRPPVQRIGIASSLVFAGALLVGLGVASVANEGLRHFGIAGSATARGAFPSVFAIVVLAPVFEELLYRERLLGALRSLWGWRWGLVVSSALFALGHMDPRVMPVAFAGGVVCGAVMLRTGSLAAVIGLHAGWNLGVVSPA